METSTTSDDSSTGEATCERRQSSDSDSLQRNIVRSDCNCYRYSATCGVGTYGIVLKAVNLRTSQEVALKILNIEYGAPREVRMLHAVSALHSKKNVIRCIEGFKYRGNTCLVFELLDKNLRQLLKEGPLTLNEIRPIAYQLLIAFDALGSIGVVHADLKLDNVMLVNHKSEPFKVKLIDFGVSFTTSENMNGRKTQHKGYRAPEVTLGLPFAEEIDMWGLGCLLLSLYLSSHPFAVNCEYQEMKGIVDMLGLPPQHLLRAGRDTCKFFIKDKHWRDPGWSLKTPWEYENKTGVKIKKWVAGISRLDDLNTLHPLQHGAVELEDRRAFVSLLKCLLQTDPSLRIRPNRALSHPFLTGIHLKNDMDCPYFKDCFSKMSVLDLEGDEAEKYPLVDEDPAKPEAAVPHITDRVKDRVPPPDWTLTTDIDAGSAVEETVVSPQQPQTILKKMKKFFNSVVKRHK